MRYLLYITLISSTLFLGVPVMHAENSEDLKFAIDRKSKELEEVTKKIQETQINLTEETVRGKTLKQEVVRIDDTVKKVSLGIHVSELTIDKLQLEIQALQGDISQKERSAELKRAAVSRLIQNYHQREREGLLMYMLDGKSLAESVSESQALEDINGGLLKEVDALRQLKTELSDRLDEVSGKKSSVERERETLKVKKVIAEDQLTQRQQLLVETKNREENYKRLITDLEKQQQTISDEISDIEEKLREQYGSSVVPSKRPGVFIKPIEGGKLSQQYGATKFAQKAYKTKFHNGVDFAVPIGTPVIAAEDGVVLMAGNNGRVQYGKYIVIKHGNGLTTLYGHLSRQVVATGAAVKRGDVIGYSGNTGYSTGAHLHFTVYLSSTVQLKAIGGAGVIPVGYTLNPSDYL